MTQQRIELGRKGEDAALEYLQAQGMKLVARNYRVRAGEIDLIMRHKNTIVFVEVRTRNKTGHGTAIDSVNYAKRRQIERVARHYLKEHKMSDSIFCRFDVVGITPGSQDTLHVEHIQNAFICGE